MIKRKKSNCQLSMHFSHSCEKISKIGTSDYVSLMSLVKMPVKNKNNLPAGCENLSMKYSRDTDDVEEQNEDFIE